MASGLPDIRLENRWIAEEEIGTFFKESDILVLPYREASQSGVAATAMAAGLPVVCTPVGGLSEQILDGRTGVIAENISAGAIAGAVRQLIADPKLYDRCSRGALAHASGAMSWANIANRYAVLAHELTRDRI